MRLTGKCHCGNIALELDWDGDPPEIPARVCDCAFCVQHGGVWTSNASSTLSIRIADPALVSKYAFATRTALFHVCARCGSAPFVTTEIAGRIYAVVNVNTLENVDPAWLRRAPSHFDGESVEERLARRERTWIKNFRVAAEEA